MKKSLIIISLFFFILACSDQEETISIPETIRIQETVIVEVTKVVETEKFFFLSPTYIPEATWTPTPTPCPAATWTPTPTPTPLPPGDLGYEKTSIITSYNFTFFGEQITLGIPIDKSPIVDHDQDGDITDDITTSDDNNFKILSVTQRRNAQSEIVLLCLTPINTPVEITFWTTRK